MLKNIEDTNLPQDLPERRHKEVWRVWIYWLEDGKWEAPGTPSFYTSETAWRRQWVPKNRKSVWTSVPLNDYRRVVAEKLESTGWTKVLDVVESDENSTWSIEDKE